SLHIKNDLCIGCENCINKCPRGVLSIEYYHGKSNLEVTNIYACKGCRKCEKVCPVKAIKVVENYKTLDYVYA
ncbi:MAG: 4Fe-4S binding protein, partial [Odoribacter sp.]|nr:4Fe-4S binding protein [Odoribacter sp.]